MRSLLRLSVEARDDLVAQMRCAPDTVVLNRPELVALARAEARGAAIYVQIDEDWTATEIEDVARARPDGIMLSGAKGNASVTRLSAVLAASEAVTGLDTGAIGVIALLTSAAGLLGAGSLQSTAIRLRGIGWDAAELAASIGAPSPWKPDGSLIAVCRSARVQCLVVAAAAGLPAFDTIDRRPDRTDRFATEVRTARREGFAGKFATNADQVSAIKAAFSGN